MDAIALLLVLVLDINNDFNLILRMSVRGNTLDADFVDVIEPHVQVFGDIVILSTWDKAQFKVAMIDGYCISIELVIRLPDKIKPGADFQLLKGFWAISETETSNVEIRQMDFLDGSVFFCFHKACTLVVQLSESKNKSGLYHSVIQPRTFYCISMILETYPSPSWISGLTVSSFPSWQIYWMRLLVNFPNISSFNAHVDM